MKRSKTNVIVARTLQDAQRELPTLVKYRVGQTAFVSAPARTAEPGTHIVTLGCTRPRIIRDPRTDEGVLTFRRFNNVATVQVEKAPGGFKVTLPERKAFFQSVERLEDAILVRAETAFLDSAESSLAQSPIVQNALNPVIEILRVMKQDQKIPLRELRGRQAYVSFLDGLRYVTVREGVVQPGPALLDFWSRNLSQEQILGDVIRQGYPHLTGPLNIQQIVPYVRAANAYFWPSHQVGRPLQFRIQDFAASLRRLYRGRYTQSYVKLTSHVTDLTQIGVFREDGNYRTASGDVWDRFEAKAASL